HDTAEIHEGSRDNVIDLMTMGIAEGIFFDTPRGIFVGRAVKPAQPVPGGVLRQLPYGFDAAAYLQANPHIAAVGAEPGEHYRRYGWAESREFGSHQHQRNGPDFLGIGAQKAATTWLYENLKRHPEIEFPAGKEVHFWDKREGRPARE